MSFLCLLPFGLLAQPGTPGYLNPMPPILLQGNAGLKPTGKSSIKPEEKIVLADTLYFMGIDMSMARLVTRQPQKGENYKENYTAEWAAIEKSICKDHNLKFDFSKKKVICKAEIFDSSYMQIDSNWVVDFYKGITAEQIAQHVKSYAPVADYRLGFVFIVDKMEGLAHGTVSMYGVYINLSDNTVVKTIRCSGAADVITSNQFWTEGIDAAYSVFMVSNQDYLHKIKAKFVKKKAKNKKKQTKKKKK